MSRKLRSQQGFTLIEIMVVVGIIGILATLAITQYSNMTARSKRAEGQAGLLSVYATQQLYYGNAFIFASTFPQLDINIIQTREISPTKLQGDIYTYDLSQPGGQNSWRCSASGNIDNDPWPDVMVMYEERQE